MVQHTRYGAATLAALLVIVGASAVRPVLAADTEIPPPAGATVVRAVQAGGAQVYTCRQAPSGAYQWSLVGPNAILVDNDGTTFGTHAPGPRWIAADGSAILGDGAHPLAVVQRPNAVPALLLTTTSSGTGVLAGVRFVRRSDTLGGVAPTDGCDAAHANARAAVHYSAVYTFYR
jgi:hypothetical protein